MKGEKLSRDKMEAFYDKLIATHEHAERKGDTIPYTSLNGHMYSFISKQDELTLKLPAESARNL